MEVTLTLDHGPLHAEVTGEDWETVESEVVEIAEFLGENDDLFENLDVDATEPTEEEQSELGSNFWEDSEEPDDGEPAPDESNHALAPLAREIDVPPTDIEDIVFADASGTDNPQIITDNSVLGDSKTGRQRNATYFLLLVWDYCYDEKRVKNSKVKTVLSLSGISDKSLYNIWSYGEYKGHFDQQGRGSSATVSLTGPGEREAKIRLQSLAETGDISDE